MATNIEEQSINNNADQLFKINHVNFNSFDSELWNRHFDRSDCSKGEGRNQIKTGTHHLDCGQKNGGSGPTPLLNSIDN